jgi:hypothetical protein
VDAASYAIAAVVWPWNVRVNVPPVGVPVISTVWTSLVGVPVVRVTIPSALYGARKTLPSRAFRISSAFLLRRAAYDMRCPFRVEAAGAPRSGAE